MSPHPYKPVYRRNLPHYQPAAATLFLTFRLDGSLPAHVLDRLHLEAQATQHQLEAIADPAERAAHTHLAHKRHFGRLDQALDAAADGPRWLDEPVIADLVAATLRHADGALYTLLAYTIMPNHVHLVLTPARTAGGSYRSLAEITRAIKGPTACEANRLLGRQGAFWQHESYDHVVRSEGERNRIIEYIRHNPVKAGLVQAPEQWPWSYCAPIDRL